MDSEIVYYDGNHYCWFDEEFWKWNDDDLVWEAIGAQPDFLAVVNGQVAVVAVTGQHYCNCPIIVVMNRGCLCCGL